MKNKILILKYQLQDELNELQKHVEYTIELYTEISTSKPSDLEISGLAGHVHSFYNGIENIFQHIAKALDGQVPEGIRYHKELLHRMTLDMPEIRPAVIDKETEDKLLDYLKFRHFYRHSYEFRLDWDQLQPKIDHLKPMFDELNASLQKFFKFLDEVARHVE